MRLLGALLLAFALATASARAATTRVFTVGPRYDAGWVDTREHFAAHLDGLIAGGVAPRRTGRDLAVLPEDVGLLAAFSGARGAPARAATDLTTAIGALVGTYAAPLAYYEGRYPSLASRGLPTRALTLGLTDTFGRVAVETFADLADRYDLWLEAGVNMAETWRVVCARADVPVPHGSCDAVDPGLVALLGEPGRDYAYEATTDRAANMALLFDPSGRLVSRQRKAYLTPVELPGQLDLAPGPVSGLSVVRTPVGRLAFVTSKDAWMPDVTAKLDAAGAQILVQPEFFVGDTVRRDGTWAPDVLKAAGYSDLLRHPSLRAMALPSLTGDVYDFSADAQSHIAVRGAGGAGGLVGQPAAPDFAQVQAWLAPDDASLSVPERRARLGAAGEAAVGTGTQPEGVLAQDVALGRPRYRPVARRRDRPIAPGRAAQRNVVLTSAGRRVWAAWEQAGRVRVARSVDAGETFGRAAVMGRGMWPSLSAGGGRVWLAWQRGRRVVYASAPVANEHAGKAASRPPKLRARPARPGIERRATRFGARDRIAHRPAPPAFSSVTRLDAAGGRQWKPSIAALPDGQAYAAWIDERTGMAGAYGARVGEPGARLDQGAPVDLAAQMDNSWAPTVAAQGDHVLAGWIDFRAYKWDVYSRASIDGGRTFADQRRADDTPDDAEALDDTPRAGFLQGAPYLAWTDYRQTLTSAVSPLYDIRGGDNAQLDGDGGRQRDAFAPALAAVDGGLALAWQSHRRRTADILARRLPAGPIVRVDDAGRRAVNSWRPALTGLPGGRVLAAWEDDRDGPALAFRRVLVLPSAGSPHERRPSSK